MSGEAMKWARAQQFGTLSLTALVAAIASRADKNGSTWVRQRTLAADVGASARHVRTLLAKAEKLGVLARIARSSGRLGRLSDHTTLAMHREFRLAAGDVRKAAASGTRLPLKRQSSKRNKTTSPSGTRLPGLEIKVKTYHPSQGKNISEGTSSTDRPRLAVVGGTALAREDGL